ncbi:MAG TPA: 23S rRNA (guanosine(2251)-2'-O)-methyltransferase RlmB [Herpetosiphonaceae bacterium]
MAELLYGRNAVMEALRAGRRKLIKLHVAEGAKESGPVGELLELARQRKLAVARPARAELDRKLAGANHQGVALEAGAYPYADLDDLLERAASQGEDPLILILDHLQDPQNIGTLLRTAELVGVHGVVIPERRAADVTPAVVNASSGAVEHLLVAAVANIAQTIETLKAANVWVAGLEDDPRAQDYDAVDLRGALAVVIGAEGPGLARLTRERCDLLLRLPMRGRLASLNAATAGSILLYHAWRARARR